MIFFNPVLLENRGEIRTLHHVKELLSFYDAGSFLYEKTPRFFVFSFCKDTIYIYVIQINSCKISGKHNFFFLLSNQ